MDKQKMKGEKNWSKKHNSHIRTFLNKIDRIEQEWLVPPHPSPPRYFDTAAFNRYIVWFRSNARTQLKPPAFETEDIMLEPNPAFSETSRLEYNRLVRDGKRAFDHAPILRFAVSSPLSSTFWASVVQKLICLVLLIAKRAVETCPRGQGRTQVPTGRWKVLQCP